MFVEGDYTRPNPSRIKLHSLLSTRAAVVPELCKERRLFASHVNPNKDSPVSYFFHVQRKDLQGHTRVCWYFDGAIVCDCCLFAQWGFYCKHLWALVAAGCITFDVTLAFDYTWRELGEAGVSTGSVTCSGYWPKDTLKVTKSWNWGVETAPCTSASPHDVFCVNQGDDDDEDQRGPIAPGTVRVSSGERRSATFSRTTLANSHPALGVIWDAFGAAFDELANDKAKSSALNQGATLEELLSPLSMSRLVSEIATNKTRKY
jgi:hypothetical protein